MDWDALAVCKLNHRDGGSCLLFLRIKIKVISALGQKLSQAEIVWTNNISITWVLVRSEPLGDQFKNAYFNKLSRPFICMLNIC